MADARRIIVRNNLFSSPSNEPYPRLEIGASGAINHKIPSRDITIVGNTFVNSGRMPSRGQGTTVIQIVPFTKPDSNYAAYGTEHGNIKVFGNIFYYKDGAKGRAYILSHADLDALSSNYNLYYAPSQKGELFQLGDCVYNNSLGKWDCDEREVLNLSAWQGRGLDKNSLESDPKFKVNPNILPHQPGEPSSLAQGLMEEESYRQWLELSSQSPAIGRGYNDKVLLGTDFRGRSRTQGGSADIGAFESPYSQIVDIPVEPTSTPTTTPTTTPPHNPGDNDNTGGSHPRLPVGSFVPFAIHSPLASWNFSQISAGGVKDTSSGLLASCKDGCAQVKNNSLVFDGKTNYLTVPNSSLLNQPQSLSVGAWVYAEDWEGNRRLVQKGDSDNQYRLLVERGSLKFDLAGVGEVAAASPSSKAWHFIVGTYDGSELSLYVDGNRVATKKANGSITSSNSNFYIGNKRNATNPKDLFKGYMASAYLWHIGLSPAEVSALYQLGPSF